MKPIRYIERTTGAIAEEKVYGGKALSFLYNTRLGQFFKLLIARSPLISSCYGFWQKQTFTQKKIQPFIDQYHVDQTEFADTQFRSFNDFFIRKLKPSARPIDSSSSVAIIPADARYWFYPSISADNPITVKGQTFDLATLLGSEEIVERYLGGSLVMARLCPTDYHRFHFPCDCLPGIPQPLNGPLYSVNPIAITQNLAILAENKRVLTLLQTEHFGQIAYIEIGATCVGTIIETFTPNEKVLKGEEKGYFSFGGSALILLFEPNRIQFSQDLIEATQKGLEIRCQLGQPMGHTLA